MTNISIALATFNGSQFLNEQLSSYVSQTVLPDELIVSDDGSQDATLDIIAEFARTAPFPVRIISGEPHLGFADNFFRAARACSSRAANGPAISSTCCSARATTGFPSRSSRSAPTA